MSIWLWIIAAWLLSYGFMRKDKVRLEHYIWLLLPVDMYGLSLTSFTLKPYMLFCFFLFFRQLKNRGPMLRVRSDWSLYGMMLILLCIVMNAVNGGGTSGVLSTTMMLVVWGCVMIYLSDCGSDTREGVCEGILAAGIGYGIVFVAAYVLMRLNLALPGLIAEERADTGIFMRMYDVVGGVRISACRLRGFTIDPNTMVGTFLYCAVVALLRLAPGKGGFREILGFVLSILCIVLSNSRMGLLCLGLVLIASLWAGYAIAKARVKKIIKGIGIVAGSILVIVLASGAFETVVNLIRLAYENRSGLNDEYGRFSIWKEAVQIWQDNGLLQGIGMGQMQYYTSTARGCHNSWLEMLCAWGLVSGGMLLIYFVSMLVGGIRVLLRRKGTFECAMVLGTLGVMVSLASVDNITYSYLWFGGAMVAAIRAGCWRKD